MSHWALYNPMNTRKPGRPANLSLVARARVNASGATGVTP
jgi:hypothetical protein